MTDMGSIGVVTFLKMFETHPETLSSFIKDVYSIKELEMNEWCVCITSNLPGYDNIF